MKLRQIPEDFKVEEISNIPISNKKSTFNIYSLEKSGIETFSLIGYLSQKNNIPSAEFGIAGLKDRHAVTKQYFTVPPKYRLNTLNEKNFKITFLGYTDKKLELGDLTGNRFEITVRDIKKGEIDGVKQKAEDIGSIGVPNYFDSQRFGSVIHNKFIAKYLIKKDYEQAAKIYLTLFTKFESSRIKDDKRNILENWDRLSKMHIKNDSLFRVVQEYNKTKSWLKAYKKIHSSLREIYISAYQSYLWNECIKELLRKKVDNKYLYTIKYNIGKLVFYKKLSKEEKNNIPDTFRSISEDIKPSGIEKDIISKVLAKEGISIEDFDVKDQTGNFFKSHERKVILKADNFKISEPLLDEINDRGRNKSFKFRLSFDLPKGSYATIITKRLFNQ
jgi:tRNA pseudouridine13 synthase